mgnify:CR=1 FL=1
MILTIYKILGWVIAAKRGNYSKMNDTYQC